MDITTTSLTDETPAGTATSAFRSLLRAGVLSGVAAAVATELVATAARAGDVSMRAGSIGAESSEPIPVLGFAFATLLWTTVGTGMAAAMGRWAKRPAYIFTVTAVVLTIVSMVPPALAGATTTGTKVILALTHVVAALIVVPALRHALAGRERR